MGLDLRGMPILELENNESEIENENENNNNKGWKRITKIINGQEFNLLAQKSVYNLDLSNAQRFFATSQSNLMDLI